MSSVIIDKNTKYDRQIRLWATNGQERLEQSHVCLVNANPAGAETLKNLVLPGIGSFTIIDHRLVTDNDLSGNFFLQPQDLGLPIAATMRDALLELNPDVKGFAIDKKVSQLLHKPQAWEIYSAVVVSGYVSTADLKSLREMLWALNIPVLTVNTSGFYATLQIFSKETTIVDTHDPSKTFDLRIDSPWPELKAYVATFDLDSLDDAEHAHVPYVVIFIKALEKWKSDHDGTLPSSYSEKAQFRSNYVEKMSRNLSIETNFQEASRTIHRALQVTSVPNSIKELMERPEIQLKNLSSTTPMFWLFMRALKDFVETSGVLPLPGNLPDMTSTTSNYVQLQMLYRQKAEKDRGQFTEALYKVLEMVGRSPLQVQKESISTFCKNSAFLFVCNGSPSLISKKLKDQLMAEEVSAPFYELGIFFGVCALHLWIDQNKEGDFDDFFRRFLSLVSVQKENLPKEILKILQEIYVHNTESYNNICSLIGGVTGQEVLKIVTAQYIPLDNLYIFDGIRSVSSKWKV